MQCPNYIKNQHTQYELYNIILLHCSKKNIILLQQYHQNSNQLRCKTKHETGMKLTAMELISSQEVISSIHPGHIYKYMAKENPVYQKRERRRRRRCRCHCHCHHPRQENQGSEAAGY